VILLVVGCTFSEGRGWGSIEAATFEAAFVPGEARDLGDGRVLTDLGYEVDLETFEVAFGELALLELQGGGNATFDPANPPPGYTLCHGGHCHSETGELVDYADVEAELAGDDATFEAVAAIPVETAADLLVPDLLELSVGSDDLPSADVSRLEVSVGDVALTGTVTDGAEWSASVVISLDVGGALHAGVELPFDRDHDPAVDLDVAVVADGTLFDGLDFPTLASGDTVSLDDLTDPGAETFVASFLSIEPTVTIHRNTWRNP
jgi:hypothetical protein